MTFLPETCMIEKRYKGNIDGVDKYKVLYDEQAVRGR